MKQPKNVFEPFVKAILKEDQVYLQQRGNAVVIGGASSLVMVQADYYNEVLRKLSKGAFVPLQDGQRAGRTSRKDLIELNVGEKYDFFKFVDCIESYTKDDLVSVIKTPFLMDSTDGAKSKIRLMKRDGDILTVFDDKIAAFDSLVGYSEWKQIKASPKSLLHYTCDRYTVAFLPCCMDSVALKDLKDGLKGLIA